jgi:hypothetical protein
VITDYAGAGTPGLPTYLVGRAEGQQGLDALRAVQRLPSSGVSAKSPVGVTGYSQGGQAAGWAAQIQPTYAPELDLKGVLAGGVPADMLAEVNHLDGNPTAGAGFALASMVGLDAAYPELDLEDRLTPLGKTLIDEVENTCYLFTAFGSVTSADVTQPDVLSDPAWQRNYSKSNLGMTPPAVQV